MTIPILEPSNSNGDANDLTRQVKRAADREALKGGVLIGSQRLSLDISRDGYDVLKTLARSIGKTPIQLAEEIFDSGLRSAWQQYLQARFIWQITNWMTWGTI